MLFVDPTRGFLDDAACKERIAAGAPYARWAADGFYQLGAGRGRARSVPDDLGRPPGHARATPRKSWPWCSSPWPTTPTSPRSRWATTRPCPTWRRRRPAGAPLPAPALRPGHQPADRPPPRAAGDEPAHGARPPPAAAHRVGRGGRAAHAATRSSSTRRASTPSSSPTRRRGRSSRSTPRSRSPTGPAGCGPRSTAWSTRPTPRSRAAPASSSSTTAAGSRAGAPSRRCSATGAVHQRLAERRLRSRTALVVVADDVLDVHAFATLLGYGADAICPAPGAGHRGRPRPTRADDGDLTSPEAQGRYQAAVEAGVLKILSKMGISTVDSYRGAQIFEVVGLGARGRRRVLHRHALVVGGIGWDGARRGRARPARGGLGRHRRPRVARLLPGPQGRRAAHQGQGHRRRRSTT